MLKDFNVGYLTCPFALRIWALGIRAVEGQLCVALPAKERGAIKDLKLKNFTL